MNLCARGATHEEKQLSAAIQQIPTGARYVITGAGGFIGARLAARFSALSSVLAIDRVFSGKAASGVRRMVADLEQPLPRDPDFQGGTVIHAAAVMNSASNAEYWRANADGTFNALEWAREHTAARFVYFSTGGVYPYAEGVRHCESAVLDPIGFYGHTKYLGEELARAYHGLWGLPITVLRPFFPYGGGQRSGIMPLIARAVRGEGKLTIKRAGAPRINPVHIDDLVHAVEAACAGASRWQVFNVCGDEEASFLDIVRMFERRLGKQAQLEFTGEEQGDLMGDNSSLKRELGWQPRQPLLSAVDMDFGV